jgi:hypothetical protein
VIETRNGGFPHVEVDEIVGAITLTFSNDEVAETALYDHSAIEIKLNSAGQPVSVEILL